MNTSKKITCVVLEDEIPAQNILKNYLSKLPGFELLAVFQTAIDANSFLTNTEVDIVFLDINLPDISGIDFIKTIKNPPAIIITTAYPDYAVSSFELDTIVDYLVKPFSFNRFLKAVNKAKNGIQKKSSVSEESEFTTIFLNVDKTLHKIIISDILYLESDRNYMTIVTDTKRLSYIDSLKSWKEKLPKKQFVQVHKSYIINAKRVDKISGNEVYLNANRIPIGRTFKQDLLQYLKIV